MLLEPRKRKFRKAQKGRMNPNLIAIRGTKLIHGQYGLMALEAGRISSKQIEAARVSINRRLRKYGKVKIRIYPNIPVTQKPTEVRMGQGKGVVDHWIFRVQPRRLLFEIPLNTPRPIAYACLKSANNKLPIRSKIIY